MSLFHVILHPTDFSDDADEAFRLACRVAMSDESKVIVLHVIPPPSSTDDGPQLDMLSEDRPEFQYCREQFQRLKSLAVEVPLTFRVMVGYTIGVILEVAKEEKADLIVIASHRRGKFHFQLHGSVAEGVLRQAECSVMCVRQPSTVT